ncbi:hypothetical protein [Modestobacter sp. Leaf380]|uniref:hypothetical protein n=1 Tax=Modestobacter sp. Leaf380 TaxID=1736356 RepID=UPI00138F61AE|nr:hypothetical protein [Modestobacter sp. Leaf380]
MSWTAPTVIVALAALALSIYNTVVARRAPAIARQQQLWDELRTVLEPLGPVLAEARSALRMGHDVPEESQLVNDNTRRLLALAPRFTEAGMEVGLNLLHVKVTGVELPWRTSIHHQKMIATADSRPLNEMFAEEQARERERNVRARDAAHRTLEAAIDVAQAEIKKWIAKLDVKDRGTTQR